MMEAESSCDICGSSSSSLIMISSDRDYGLVKDKFRLVKCSSCGLFYLNPMPKESQTYAWYPEEYFSWTLLGKVGAVLYNTLRAQRIMRFRPSSNRRVLDLGCGDGSFLSIMKRYRWEACGVDPSPAAASISKQKGLKVFNCSLEECKFPEDHFSVITMWHVLEHVPKPAKLLKEVSSLLKNDGVLALVVPNINSLQFRIFRENWAPLRIPRHLYQFSFETLKLAGTEAGLDLVNVGKSFENPLDWLHSLFRSVNRRYEDLPKILLPAVLALTAVSLPFTILLSTFKRGPLIEAYFRKSRIISSGKGASIMKKTYANKNGSRKQS